MGPCGKKGPDGKSGIEGLKGSKGDASPVGIGPKGLTGDKVVTFTKIPMSQSWLVSSREIPSFYKN